MQPYGNVGDRKNDGYIPNSGTFYQLYAPTRPGERLGSAAKKLVTDFDGLRKYWQAQCPIKSFRFAFNDEYGGSVKPLEDALAAIASAHKITAAPFLCKDLEAEALSLPDDKLQDVLGMIIPESGLIADADYYAVRDVVEHVMASNAELIPEGKLLAPEFDAKIRFNGLSERVAHLLRNAALQTDVVDDFFSNRSGTHRQDLRDHLAAIYASQRTDSANSAPDVLFFAILRAITPKTSALKRAVQDAALVVMAYYFEACDIFEDPNATA